MLPIIGAGLSALGGILGSGARRRNAQEAANYDARTRENQFLIQNPSFQQDATFKRRLLGNLGNSFLDSTYGAGAEGSPGRVTISRLDPRTLFQNINAGQFGEDLRGTNLSDIKMPDFTPQKVHGNFWGDLFSGVGGVLGGGLFGGGGGVPAGVPTGLPPGMSSIQLPTR